MTNQTLLTPDILISGAGIAGLWLFNHLKSAGYDVLLLEREAIGCGQTVASQGIIHSGLKYAFAGQINNLARSISAMPDLWRDALAGKGPVDLRAVKTRASSQYLLIPSGLMGGLIGLVTKKALGNNVHKLKKSEWPEGIVKTGFNGTVIFMDEPVLDVPSALQALASKYEDSIRKADILDAEWSLSSDGGIDHVTVGNTVIRAQRYIFTAAESNLPMAKKLGHSGGLETQARPLLMGLMHNAPCELYAHCVGPSDKPVMTITTHKAADGSLIWYLGGGVAERRKDADPQDVYKSAKDGFQKYMPNLDLSAVRWSALPIDRVEGKSRMTGHLPDTPTIHAVANALYCWPTKLTFSPMLTNQIMDMLKEESINPSGTASNYESLPPCKLTKAPWDQATWTEAA